MESGISLLETVKAVLEGRESIKRCRVCLGDTELGYMSLTESVRLPQSYCQSQLTLLEIFKALNIQLDSEPNRSSVLCANCTRAAVNSYIFRELCTYSQKLYTRAEHMLIQCDLKALEIRQKRVYIVLGDPPMFLKKSPCTNTKQVECSNCERIFVKKGDLKRHSCRRVTRHVTFPCPDCERVFSTRSKYQVHHDRAHGQKLIKCESCPRRFASRFLAAEHSKAMHILGECHICGKMYTTRKGLRGHERTHALEWVCVCGRVYKYCEGLRLHERRCTILRQQSEKITFSCPHCCKTYDFKHSLRQHIKFAHSDNPIRCEYCQKKFIAPIALRNHMSVHTGVKNYACKECNATFVSATTLKYHTRASHTGEKPFPCNQCSETFITSFRRLVHMRRRHGTPAPTCPECGLSFTTLARLRKHRLSHAPTPIDDLTIK